ncbi:carboxypeptidase regulatory-like domain-containing protein, partial [Candidatus Roizmanbacteria bacterium]|nr:carboxypeptidase regulatory-like domain-containing protein [Candidatus Roizmanbacteria bacterium]
AGLGLAFAFLPINDRPLDVWIRNLVKRLTSPTQYKYHKQNLPVYFLSNLYFVDDPHRVLTHVESREKLAHYLSKTQPKNKADPKKNEISLLLRKPNEALVQSKPKKHPVIPVIQPSLSQQQQPASHQQPFFTGVVKNHKTIPLPGILIYVKGGDNQVVRLLKTNPHGVFATFNLLPSGEYTFEFKDPRNTYFFDTMKVKIDEVNQKPLEFYSRELI